MACRIISSCIGKFPQRVTFALSRRGMSSFDPCGAHGVEHEPHSDVQLVAQRLANAKRSCTEISMKDMKTVTDMKAAYDVQTAICFIVTKFNK
jgi:hypothetical protein